MPTNCQTGLVIPVPVADATLGTGGELGIPEQFRVHSTIALRGSAAQQTSGPPASVGAE